MIVAGCDVGSLTTKAVVMRDARIIASAVIKSKARPDESATQVMENALKQCSLTQREIDCCVGTGYGREKIPFVDYAVSEISCHAKGAKWLVPMVRTVIDIGGQDCKAIKLEGDRVAKFIANDKCASGTGRFLEVMAQVLGIEISEIGMLSKKSRSPIALASMCTVWAQADVIKKINSGIPIEDIGAGINNAMANRIAMLVSNIRAEKEICMTGGVAKNTGVITALEKMIGCRIKKINKVDPQLVGAIGAALMAAEKK